MTSQVEDKTGDPGENSRDWLLPLLRDVAHEARRENAVTVCVSHPFFAINSVHFLFGKR